MFCALFFFKINKVNNFNFADRQSTAKNVEINPTRRFLALQYTAVGFIADLGSCAREKIIESQKFYDFLRENLKPCLNRGCGQSISKTMNRTDL